MLDTVAPVASSLCVYRMKKVLGYPVKISELRWTHSYLKDTTLQPVDYHGHCTTLPLILNTSTSVEKKWMLYLMRKTRKIWNGVHV